MATYGDKNFNSAHYNDSRPTYPQQFYDAIVAHHKNNGGKTVLAMDVGCGPGFAAFKLTDYFTQVIGTDLSQTMIDECNRLKSQFLAAAGQDASSEAISFFQAPGEKAPHAVKPDSVDLITAAECVHWMDIPQFYRESARVLKPNGTLCYWHYLDPVFMDSEDATQIHMKYSFGLSKEDEPALYEKYFGPYFENPGHDRYRDGLKDFLPSAELFTHVERHEFHPLHDDPSSTPLYIEKQFTLRSYEALARSWSGYHNWKKANPDKRDAVECLMQEMEAIFGSDYDKPLRVVFPTVYTLATKK